MSTMMLTALDANSGEILNLVNMDLKTRDMLHGRRNATRHGYDPICRQCQHPTHLTVNHRDRSFWKHNPGSATRCILDSITRGESAEHIAAKYAIASAIDRLGGWKALPEERFADKDHPDDYVIIDVYAQHLTPAAHQMPTAWEVQLGRQTHGWIETRTHDRQRLANCRTAWITPHRDALADSLGVITNPTATHVVDRIYTSPWDDREPLPPVQLGQFANLVARRRGHYHWSQSGDDGEWIAYPASSVGNVEAPKTNRRNARPDLDDADDRACQRTPQTTPAAPPAPATQLFAPPVSSGYQTSIHAAIYTCDECGDDVASPWGFTSDPPRCKPCFTTNPHRYMNRGA